MNNLWLCVFLKCSFFFILFDPQYNMTEQTNINKHLSTSSEDIDDNNKIDPDSRIEFLERNLHYIQQQHETTLFDLHNEINRLQQENKGIDKK